MYWGRRVLLYTDNAFPIGQLPSGGSTKAAKPFVLKVLGLHYFSVESAQLPQYFLHLLARVLVGHYFAPPLMALPGWVLLRSGNAFWEEAAEAFVECLLIFQDR